MFGNFQICGYEKIILAQRQNTQEELILKYDGFEHDTLGSQSSMQIKHQELLTKTEMHSSSWGST